MFKLLVSNPGCCFRKIAVLFLKRWQDISPNAALFWQEVHMLEDSADISVSLELNKHSFRISQPEDFVEIDCLGDVDWNRELIVKKGPN